MDLHHSWVGVLLRNSALVYHSIVNSSRMWRFNLLDISIYKQCLYMLITSTITTFGRTLTLSSANRPVRLASGWWLVLICSEIKVLPTSC